MSDWEPLAATAPQPSGDWEPAGPQAGNDNMPPPTTGFSDAVPGLMPEFAKQAVGPIMQAFGRGFNERFGDEPLGLSADSMKFINKEAPGLLASETSEGDFKYTNPLQAFHDLLTHAIVAAPELTYRGISGIMGGLGAVSEQLGLPRDVSGILAGEVIPTLPGGIKPAAPHGMPERPTLVIPPKLAEPLPSVRPDPIRPIEGSPASPGLSRTAAAQTGIPEVDAVLNSPEVKAKIDNPVVDRSHDVPYMAGPAAELNDPTVYIDRHVPREQTAPRLSGEGTVTFDPADAWVIHENVEQHTMELLIKGGVSREEAYRVAHWDYAEPAEQAWYRAHDIDQVAAEKEQSSWLPRIQHENPENPPPNLYEKPYPHDSVQGVEHESVTEVRPSPEETARAKEIIANAPLGEKAIDLGEARSLGVIGEERKTLTEDGGTPKEVAERAVPIDPAVEKVTPLLPDGGWQARFDQFVSKLEQPSDIKTLIHKAADENDNFPNARQGDIPLNHVDRIAEAAGVEPGEINRRGLGRMLRNDAEVRIAMQLMVQATENAKSIAKDVVASATDDNLIKFQESLMRRDMAVEQIVGLRAEWGRTGNVFQEFMREVKDATTLNEFLKEKCPL